jgi:hypothetical protein
MYNVSPDYFRASGTSLLAGRAFSWHDDTNDPRVAVVNPEFASKITDRQCDSVGVGRRGKNTPHAENVRAVLGKRRARMVDDLRLLRCYVCGDSRNCGKNSASWRAGMSLKRCQQ